MLTRKVQVLAIAETPSNGTWTAPGGTNGILAYEPVATPEFEMYKRDPYRSDLSRDLSLSGKQTATITFKVELRGTGSSATPPTDIQLLLNACGFVPSSTDLMIPKSTAITTISIQIEEDGIKKQFKGCAGNVRIVGVVGEPVMLEFTFRGTIHAITAGGMTTLTGLNTTVPPVLLSAAFSTNVGGAQSHLINSIEFDMQNEIAIRPSASSATGILAADITGRNPVGSFDPEYNTTYDWLAAITTNTAAASIGTLTLNLGSVTNNKIQITAPQIRFMAMNPGDRDGVRILTVPFELNRSAGNDEIKLDWSFT